MFWCIGLALAGEWRVVDTPHFRLHYPREAEAFSLNAAAQLESIRERVAGDVGFDPEFKTQIVVRDPYGESNGMALPLGRAPRVELWATPPPADSVIGHYDDWAVDLVLHEDVHVVHLLKPPRGLSGQLMYAVFKMAPIQVKSPRWITEGYATLAEGTLTRAGRPNGDFRATLLRQLAVSGELPTYAELNFSTRWQGRSFAYTVGSAYLEWLVEREGKDSLDRLWRRMTSKRVRSFDIAFRGVYGDRASVLYKRFTAELTAAAMNVESPSDDTLWLNTRGDLGKPALSPDGAHLAVVTRAGSATASLVVWETAVNDKAVQRRAERIDKLLLRDPEDAAPKDPKTPPRQRRATLNHRTHIPHEPRWLDDDTLLYTATVADAEGQIRRDVYRWDLDRSPRRLTRGGDVHRVDTRAGRIVGLTSRWGRTGIVEISPTGTVSELIAPSALEVVDQPRLSPDGASVAFLRNAGDGYRLWVLDAAGERQLDTPPEWQIRQISWGPRGIVASVGIGGRLDLVRFEDDGPVRLTTSGAAFAPEPGETDLFHLEMHGRGFRIHRRDPAAASHPIESVDAGLAGRPEPPGAAPFALTVTEGRRMGLGKLEPRILVSGMVGVAASNFEVGLRLGDLVGRNELAVLGSLGVDTGAGFWWRNSTLPASFSLRGWALRDVLATVSLGAGATATIDTSSSAAVAQLELGGWGETGRAAGHAEISTAWIEPQARWLYGSFGVRGSAGADSLGPNAIAQVGGRVTAGRAWYLRAEGSAGIAAGTPFSLGGVRSAVRADAAQWRELQIGWLPPDTDRGRLHDHFRTSLGREGISLAVERRRIHTDSDTTAFTFAGLHVEQDLAAQPLLRLPALQVEMGLGCVFERDGLVPRACRNFQDWSAWSALTWTP